MNIKPKAEQIQVIPSTNNPATDLQSAFDSIGGLGWAFQGDSAGLAL